jgi:hypothetical protein
MVAVDSPHDSTGNRTNAEESKCSEAVGSKCPADE